MSSNNIVQLYRIETITDTHVGTGESGFGFIDNIIQRDSATGYPCFNSSGMKGAIKQHINAYSEHGKKTDLMKAVFGSTSIANENGKNSDTQQGEGMFLTAHILALPVRTDTVSYVLATSPELIKFYENSREQLGLEIQNSLYGKAKKLIKDNDSYKAICFDKEINNAELDIVGTKVKYTLDADLKNSLRNLLKAKDEEKIVFLPSQTMAELCSDLYLPIIARNVLDDGESQNLWHEQILPRFSRLYFAGIWRDEEQQQFIEDTLTESNKKLLQVGANASISYGLTSVTKM